MNHIHEKGTNVTHRERSQTIPQIASGLFASFRALLHVRGRGTSSSASVVSYLAAFGAAITFLTLAAPTPVLAASGEFTTAPTASSIHATRASIHATIQAGNIPTKWLIEYSTSETGPRTLAASGEGGGAQIFPRATIQHLTPDTTYYVQVSASNQAGIVEAATKFTTTAIGPPEFQGQCANGFNTIGEFHFNEEFRELCAHAHTTSIDLKAQIEANGANTEYQFEYATSEAGPYNPVPSANGTVTATEDFADPEFTLTGLSPETIYYPRVTVTNEKGSNITRKGNITTASIKPQAMIEGRGNITKITGVSANLSGNVYPGTYETHWHFEYASSEAGPYSSVPGANGTITAVEAGEEVLPVQGDLSGLNPATTYYVRLFAENVNASSTSNPPVGFETAGPPLVTTFAVHALHGEMMRALGSVRPDGLDTHYDVQYVSQEQFAATGWAEAQSTPELDAGSGEFSAERSYPTTIVGADLPGLTPGRTYDYRLLASNETGAVQGAVQTLTVPAPAAPSEPAACPNEALRTGPSASLLDCRAYEQITPVDKEGAQEIANYGINAGGPGALVGEDGEHVMFGDEIVSWGPGPHDGQSPYFFTRTETGWRMVAAASQPETGVFRPFPALFSPDLTEFAFESFYNTGVVHGQSLNREFDVGPPGGPYTLLASVPTAESGVGGLVAGSEDFSKLVLQVEDRNLAESPTGTSVGKDLYEYSRGQLRQLNVLTDGSPVGSCGAKIVMGHEEYGYAASRHAVSTDGSRVFFEAVPGNTCSAPSHLYMRETTAGRTVDLGADSFFGANPQGTMVLFEKRVGETHEVFLYETESAVVTPLFTAHHVIVTPIVSEDLTAIYFHSAEQLDQEAPPASPVTGFKAEDLYRYDIPTKTLRFIVQIGLPGPQHVNPDGRFYTFEAPSTASPQPTGHAVAGLPGGAKNTTQVYRYDSAEDLLECISCASSFDPEPGQPSVFGSNFHLGRFNTQDGLPNVTVASANGDYAFFSTASALLPSDVDGEVAPELRGGENNSIENDTSVSSDVYEWRKNGVGGCTHVQGCLSLITNGRGGFMNLFIGSADEGRDVFFITASQLVPSDSDTALDIYDARIGGGFPPPAPRPVECEGDSCSTPFTAPNDLTPSSSTFQGVGNVLVAALPEVKAKPKAKPKPKKKTKTKKKGAKSKRKGRKASVKHAGRAGRARHATMTGRAGK